MDCHWLFTMAGFNMLQPKLLRPWPGQNSKHQVNNSNRRLFHREGGTHSFRVQCGMRGRVCQCRCSSLEDSWGGLHGITIDQTFYHNTSCNACHVDFPCWLVLVLWLHFWKESLNIHFVQCLSHHRCMQGFSFVHGCFGSVHSSACSAQLFQNHRNDRI